MNRIYMIGHSTRPIQEFVAMLKRYGVDLLIDIRTIPRSRRVPDYNLETLPRLLEPEGIGYEHIAALGGLRKPKKDSPNGGWRNESFRGYADYMQTDEFKSAVDDLVRRASLHTLALMCAEAVPWRCHRSLVGDALLVRGAKVIDIMDLEHLKPETITPFARVSGTEITYPPSENRNGTLF